MHSYMQHDSYFPPSPAPYTHTFSLPLGGYQARNIDDIVYRYSAEFDHGTPTAGVYAQDGIWDEDDAVSLAHTARPASSTASVVTRKELSLKGRSRSGTVSTVAQREEKSGGMWGWAKKAQSIETPMSPETTKVASKEHDLKGGLRKEKSRSRLRGKGRRGELSLAFVGDADESVSLESF